MSPRQALTKVLSHLPCLRHPCLTPRRRALALTFAAAVFIVASFHGDPYDMDVIALAVTLLAGFVLSERMSSAAIPCAPTEPAAETAASPAVEAAATAEPQPAPETAAAETPAAPAGEPALSPLKEFAKKVEESSLKLAGAANSLREASKQITAKSSDTRQQAETVTNASRGITQVVGKLSGSAQELLSSVEAVDRTINLAAQNSLKAKKQADEAEGSLSELANATAVINSVVGLITKIAAQTNLLALNATIEAARAGEAGRGFAVVAGEVKALSKQTAEATDKIREATQSIKSGIEKVSADIRSASTLIGTVSETNTELTRTIEQQRETTGQITHNLQNVAQDTSLIDAKIQQVNLGVASTSDTLAVLSSAIDDVAQEVKLLRRVTTTAAR